MKITKRDRLLLVRHWFKWYTPDLLGRDLYRLKLYQASRSDVDAEIEKAEKEARVNELSSLFVYTDKDVRTVLQRHPNGDYFTIEERIKYLEENK